MRLTLALTLAGMLFTYPGPVLHSSSAGVASEWTLLGGWLDDDPADSLYKAARAALNASNYRNAAELFRRIRDEQPKSRYVADSYYWEAFARYRSGGSDDLREARRLLAE